jgi:hypothetical protein
MAAVRNFQVETVAKALRDRRAVVRVILQRVSGRAHSILCVLMLTFN